MRKFFCLLICLCMLGTMPLFAGAEGTVIKLDSLEDFLHFAENCRLDRYSPGLTVKLCRDLDLTGTDFAGIPTFSGTFDGCGFRIIGLELTQPGSHVGLFRYLTTEALVKNLHVSGVVAPEGSREYVGGIAGENAGRIENCSFSGTVSGSRYVGGIAGTQTLSGLIQNCSAAGSIQGTHFVGGIAGENAGVIRNSENSAAVNTLLEQNKVSLGDITLDTLLGTESVATVTDIGGIAGIGTGVIRNCKNKGDVGYPQIGYNIGGIIGSTGGYVESCTNSGTVQGRKEVGGIAGQLEPAIGILFSEDALQKLKDQMGGMAGIASAMGSHAGSGVSALREQASRLDQEVTNAKEAVGMLSPSPEFPFVPDLDTVQASKNALASSLSGMNETVSAMASISKSTMSAISSDVQNLAGQLSAIGGTVATASDNLGASVTDVSGLDTPDDMTAKISGCTSSGAVTGDWNVGGIVGSMAIENDLDPDTDLDLLGEYSLHFDMELRCVITDCQSSGTVTGKKENIGGIVGWMSLGMVRGCISTGDVNALSAEYTGGIAGRSHGILRDDAYRGTLAGSRFSGGIAGSAEEITDCVAVVALSGSGEFRGAILGSGKKAVLSHNYYLPVDRDPGAVDGLSYAERAQMLDQDGFLALENLPEAFRTVTLTFRFDDGTETQRILPYGTRLSEDHFPQLPALAGAEGCWNSSLSIGDPLCFDTFVETVYVAHSYTLSAENANRNGLPLLLVQGDFLPGSTVTMTRRNTDGLDAWDLNLPESASTRKLRYLPPEGFENVALRGLTDDLWTDLEYTRSGSYLVFEAPENLTAIELRELPPDKTPTYLAIAGGAALLILILTVILVCRSKRKKETLSAES